MILVDTSVWIDHFRNKNHTLVELLQNGSVQTHPYVIGELACGSIASREKILTLLQALPQSQVLSQTEFLYFVNSKHLMGKGIGFIDIHLLASAALAGSLLWTIDKKLNDIAAGFKLNFIHKINH